jgi:hypothetical protein
VIEAPPTTDSPDAQTLAGVADLAVLVVESGQSSAREVIDAVAQVESMHAAVLGAVIARYGRDGDPDQKRRAADALAYDDEDDDLEELDEVEETEDSDDRRQPAVEPAEAEVVEEPVRTGATATSALSTRPPSVDDDDDEDYEDDQDEDDEVDVETTVLPTGGRPQLVPPGSAGPAQR